jgi:hypothetical protein
MYQRLEGFASYDSPQEVWVDDDVSTFPIVDIFDGFVDDDTGFITLFGSFDLDDELHYAVIYITGWASDTIHNIESIQDALKVEWLNVEYSIYLPNQDKEFYDVLEDYSILSKVNGGVK